ncbi:MAG: GntR family transcriptional regulator [bacterium]
MPEASAHAFEQRLRQLDPLEVPHRTAAKYRLISERLERAAAAFPPGTRLPSVRSMAEIFGVTPVPIHRAVTELVQRGVLNAEVGRGIYIARAPVDQAEPTTADAPPAADEPEPLELFEPIVSHCTFAVRSHLAHHRRFWRQAAAQFERHYPLTKIDWRPDGRSAPQTSVDARELSTADTSFDGETERAHLNLVDFAGEDRESSLTLLSPDMAPIHLNVPCLFFNKDLLKRENLPQPRFHSFADQVRYFESLPETAGSLAVSVVQPLAWLGRTLRTVLDWLGSDASPGAGDRREVLAMFEAMGRIHRRMRCLPRGLAFSADAFAQGTLPLFHGWSYSYGYLRSRDLPFEFGVVPWLGSDDHLLALPMCLAIASDADHYAESVRLVRPLQSPEMQQLLAATDNLPFDTRYSDATFLAHDSEPAFVRNLFENAYLHDAWTSAELYLSRHVINDELRRYLGGRVSASAALDEILWLGRGASRQFMRRNKQKAPALAGASADVDAPHPFM